MWPRGRPPGPDRVAGLCATSRLLLAAASAAPSSVKLGEMQPLDEVQSPLWPRENHCHRNHAGGAVCWLSTILPCRVDPIPQ